jgi:seryl-tRNA synthetase
MSDIEIITNLIKEKFTTFERKIEHFDKTINDHIVNSAEAVGDIKLLKNNQDIIAKDLQKNFDQHKEFYGLFKIIDQQPNPQILINDLRKDFEKENKDLKEKLKTNTDTTEQNEKDITKYKNIIMTLQAIGGILIIVLSILIKTGVIKHENSKIKNISKRWRIERSEIPQTHEGALR